MRLQFFFVTLAYPEYLSRQLGISEPEAFFLASVFAKLFFNNIGKGLSKLRSNLMTVEELGELWGHMMLTLRLIEKLEAEFEESERLPQVYKELYEMNNHLRLYITYYIRKMPVMEDLREIMTALDTMAIGFDLSQGLLEPGPPEYPLGLGCWRRDRPSGPMNVGERGIATL